MKRQKDVFDISIIGVYKKTEKEVTIEQNTHGFRVGDVLYYDTSRNIFDKALAINYIDSEVCGVVSTIVSNNVFKILAKGELQTNLFAAFEEGTELYLSDVIPGKLLSIESQTIVKKIATTTKDGIIIDIQRGFQYDSNNEYESDELEPYTKDELDEIIRNI